jgi:hypothetical protein
VNSELATSSARSNPPPLGVLDGGRVHDENAAAVVHESSRELAGERVDPQLPERDDARPGCQSAVTSTV